MIVYCHDKTTSSGVYRIGYEVCLINVIVQLASELSTIEFYAHQNGKYDDPVNMEHASVLEVSGGNF